MAGQIERFIVGPPVEVVADTSSWQARLRGSLLGLQFQLLLRGKDTAAALNAKAERDEARARQNKHKALIATINQLMTRHPTIVIHLHELAIKLSSSEEFQGVAAKPASVSKPAEKIDFDVELRDVLSKPLERFKWSLEKLAVQDLKCILYSLNHSWTPFSLLALKTRPTQREIPKEPLLEVLEFVIGMAKSTPLGQSYFKCIGDVAAFLKAKAALLPGDRCGSLHIPPRWEAEGLYEMQVDADEVLLTHRFTNTKVTIANDDPRFRWSQPEAVQLHHNYSHETSHLQESDNPLCLFLRELYTSDGRAKNVIPSLLDGRVDGAKMNVIPSLLDGQADGSKKNVIPSLLDGQASGSKKNVTPSLLDGQADGSVVTTPAKRGRGSLENDQQPLMQHYLSKKARNIHISELGGCRQS